jgi:hypothetical protein
LFNAKAIAAFATIACVFSAQQGTAGNAEFIAARPTLMLIPMAAIAPVAISASASAEAAIHDYDSPARQIVFPGLEEQILENALEMRIPVPTSKPVRSLTNTIRDVRPAKVRSQPQVVRIKAEQKRIVTASAVGLTTPMQPIIGAFR